MPDKSGINPDLHKRQTEISRLWDEAPKPIACALSLAKSATGAHRSTTRRRSLAAVPVRASEKSKSESKNQQ
jgi:hypothetical protein